MSTVGIFPCRSYDPQEVTACLVSGLAQMKDLRFAVSAGETVLLKPNLLAPSGPDDAVCTHPAVMEGVIRWLKDLGAEVWVGDSPGFGSTAWVAREAGILGACERAGARLVSFSSAVSVPFSRDGISGEFSVADWVVKADKVINLPKLKLHGLMGMTGAVKNMFGCMPGPRKGMMHLKNAKREDFAQMLVDFYSCVKPALNIMDAIVGMEGMGPRNGDPRYIGRLLASEDGVAMDAVAARLIGMDPGSVPTITIGSRQGVGTGRLKDIEILGASLEESRVAGFALQQEKSGLSRVPILGRFLTRGKKTRVEIDLEKCKRCQVCVQSCPPRAISLQRGSPVVDVSTCIGCLCCQELCPEGAVKIRRGRD